MVCEIVLTLLQNVVVFSFLQFKIDTINELPYLFLVQQRNYLNVGIFLCAAQNGKAAEKTPAKPCDVEVYEKKIRLLEKQRKDVSLLFLILL